MKGKAVLVTGGTGFLGRRLCDFLVKEGATTITYHAQDCDFRDKDQTEQVFREVRPEVVFHLAGKVGGIKANQERPAEFIFDNLQMGLNVIDACARFGVEKLVNVGSVCSYPYGLTPPFWESEMWCGYPEPTNAPYGIAKRTTMAVVQAYAKQYSLNAVNLILANLYGPGQSADLNTTHVIPALIRKFLEAREHGNKTVTVWGTGEPTRDFLYVDDCARALVKAAKKVNDPTPLNIGSGREVSVRSLAERIKEITRYEGRIEFDTSKPDGQPRRALACDEAKLAFGFTAPTTLSDGLKKTIKWYRAHAGH